jgi:hypothetical protein
MTLQQFHSVKSWHSDHQDHPTERNVWDVVLTLWMVGWIGGAASVLLLQPWAWVGCFALLFLPRAYVALRRRLHRLGRLRCDWITAIR